jgi:hypothetical protein
VDHTLGRLTVDRRLRLVLKMGETFDRTGRERGYTAGASALLPLIYRDSDLNVVSTAAIVLAESGPSASEPLQGPRYVIELARRCEDSQRKGSILGGLAHMGDARIYSLVLEAWPSCDVEAKMEILRTMGASEPAVAAFEFIVAGLEIGASDEAVFGSAAGILRRLTLKAQGRIPSASFGRGFIDVERSLPSWTSATRSEVVRVNRCYSVREFARQIAPRLRALATNESRPQVIPTVLTELGVDRPDPASVH